MRVHKKLLVECLEAREMLAFSGVLDGDTLRLNQTNDDGHVLVDNNGPAGEFRIIDGAGTQVFESSENLIVSMLRTGNDLTLDFDHQVTGFVRTHGTDGNIRLSGDSNTVGGNLHLFGGNSDQTVDLAINSDLNVGGNLMIGGGNGHDEIKVNGRQLTVGENFRWDRVNEFINDGVISIAGNFSTNFYDEQEIGSIENQGVIRIGGGISYSKFDNGFRAKTDRLLLGGDSRIEGPIFVNLGNGIGQEVSFEGAVVGGRVTVVGGNRDDSITLGMTQQSLQRVNLELGLGDDNVNLGDEELGSLRIDFGGGDDSLHADPNLKFDAAILNWRGTSQFYRSNSSTLRIVQQTQFPEMTLDDGGTQGSFRVTTVGLPVQSFVADDFRIQMVDHSNTTLNLNFTNQFMKHLTVNAMSGDRQIRFVGPVNEFEGEVRIIGGSDDQVVVLDESAGDLMAGTIQLNLGEGSNKLETNGKAILSRQNMFLRGITQLTNTGALSSGNNLVINQRLASEPTRFRNLGTVDVGGDFVFLGGRHADRLFFDGVENIDGNTQIRLGNAKSGKQSIRLGNNFSSQGSVSLSAGDSTGDFEFVSSSNVFVGGNFFLNTSALRSILSIAGDFAGSFGTINSTDSRLRLTIDIRADHMVQRIFASPNNDRLILRKTTILEQLFVDFGSGRDTLVDEFNGVYPFPVTLLNS